MHILLKKGGYNLMERFVSENARLAWKLFELTGDTNFYRLYSGIQHPSKEQIYEESTEREM